MKRIISLFLAVFIFTFSVSAVAEEYEAEPDEQDTIQILILGHSLFYFNKMDSVTLPEICKSMGKNVKVTSVIESGTTLYRLTSEKTTVGKQVIEEIEKGIYDYVIFSPTRRVTPFEYTVFEAEKQAALKLNKKINEYGAKTLICVQPGFNLGYLPVYTMNDDGIGSTLINDGIPMERATHGYYYKSLCQNFLDGMENASLINYGDATETVLSHYNISFYNEDNRHPSTRGSYLQACCIYSAIFNESCIGCDYTSSLYDYNALLMQRAAAVSQLGFDESIITDDDCQRVLNANLIDNSTAKLIWDEPKNAEKYNIYRKVDNESFSLIDTTETNQTEYTDFSLEKGKKYTYKIKAINTVGNLTFVSREYSNSVSVTPLSNPILNAVKLDDNINVQLDITPTLNAEFYSIYRIKNDGKKAYLIGSTTTMSFIDNTVKSGDKYTYYIVANKRDNKVLISSNISNKKSIVALKKVKAKLTAQKKRVNFSLTKQTKADGYAIYQKIDGKYTLIKTTKLTNFKIKNLSPKTKYYFKIYSYKGSLTSKTRSVPAYYTVTTK